MAGNGTAVSPQRGRAAHDLSLPVLIVCSLSLPLSSLFVEARRATMKCPNCRVDNDRVIDSRSSEEGFAIRRRRECLNCKHRYTTYERLEEGQIKVIKRNGARESFSREKMRQGIAKACWKRR